MIKRNEMPRQDWDKVGELGRHLICKAVISNVCLDTISRKVAGSYWQQWPLPLFLYCLQSPSSGLLSQCYESPSAYVWSYERLRESGRQGLCALCCAATSRVLLSMGDSDDHNGYAYLPFFSPQAIQREQGKIRAFYLCAAIKAQQEMGALPGLIT